MENIVKRVNSILTEKLGILESEITPEANFIKDLGIDSLDYAELVMEFEDEFETSIPDEEAEKIQTVGQAVDFIKEHMDK